jgi:PIN domain nuclease of toxin-antitoxin system
LTVVLDTHVWIWWVAAPNRLSRKAKSRIAASRRIGISAVSCLEVATAVAKGRIGLDRDVLEWLQTALSPQRVELVALTPQIAVAAAQLGRDFPGDPADRVIAATAILESAVLLTKDQRLHGRAGLLAEW